MTTILFVEDHPDTRDIISLLLSSHGFAVKTVDNFYSALEMLQKTDSSIDLMLLDYNLPGMPMDDFLRRVDQLRPGIPIVLTTAAYRCEEKAHKHGIKWWIPKPIDTDRLCEIINEATRGSRSTNDQRASSGVCA